MKIAIFSILFVCALAVYAECGEFDPCRHLRPIMYGKGSSISDNVAYEACLRDNKNAQPVYYADPDAIAEERRHYEQMNRDIDNDRRHQETIDKLDRIDRKLKYGY